jgi:hypothetical protein
LVLPVTSACTPRTRYSFDHPGMSEAQFERHYKECTYEALKVAASSDDGGAIVFGEKALLLCLELRGIIYKGKTVSWN